MLVSAHAAYWLPHGVAGAGVSFLIHFHRLRHAQSIVSVHVLLTVLILSLMVVSTPSRLLPWGGHALIHVAIEIP